jgi:hypothetical protein
MSESLYSIILDGDQPVPVQSIFFEGPHSDFLAATPEKIRITTMVWPELELGPTRLRIDRAGVTMLDTFAWLGGWVGGAGSTVLEFELRAP